MAVITLSHTLSKPLVCYRFEYMTSLQDMRPYDKSNTEIIFTKQFASVNHIKAVYLTDILKFQRDVTGSKKL